jgi:hypothetical protein
MATRPSAARAVILGLCARVWARGYQACRSAVRAPRNRWAGSTVQPRRQRTGLAAVPRPAPQFRRSGRQPSGRPLRRRTEQGRWVRSGGWPRAGTLRRGTRFTSKRSQSARVRDARSRPRARLSRDDRATSQSCSWNFEARSGGGAHPRMVPSAVAEPSAEHFSSGLIQAFSGWAWWAHQSAAVQPRLRVGRGRGGVWDRYGDSRQAGPLPGLDPSRTTLCSAE